MFETLESRQLLSTTLAGDTITSTTDTQPPPADSQPIARKAGGDQQEYLIVKLKTVYVTSYTIGGSPA